MAGAVSPTWIERLALNLPVIRTEKLFLIGKAQTGPSFEKMTPIRTIRLRFILRNEKLENLICFFR